MERKSTAEVRTLKQVETLSKATHFIIHYLVQGPMGPVRPQIDLFQLDGTELISKHSSICKPFRLVFPFIKQFILNLPSRTSHSVMNSYDLNSEIRF